MTNVEFLRHCKPAFESSVLNKAYIWFLENSTFGMSVYFCKRPTYFVWRLNYTAYGPFPAPAPPFSLPSSMCTLSLYQPLNISDGGRV